MSGLASSHSRSFTSRDCDHIVGRWIFSQKKQKTLRPVACHHSQCLPSLALWYSETNTFELLGVNSEQSGKKEVFSLSILVLLLINYFTKGLEYWSRGEGGKNLSVLSGGNIKTVVNFK